MMVPGDTAPNFDAGSFMAEWEHEKLNGELPAKGASPSSSRRLLSPPSLSSQASFSSSASSAGVRVPGPETEKMKLIHKAAKRCEAWCQEHGLPRPDRSCYYDGSTMNCYIGYSACVPYQIVRSDKVNWALRTLMFAGLCGATQTLSPIGSPVTKVPTQVPSQIPTYSPSTVPSQAPTIPPTVFPSQAPSDIPTVEPTAVPTFIPSKGVHFTQSCLSAIFLIVLCLQHQGC